MSIGPLIPEIQHFQSLTLKIKGQGHSSRSQNRYSTLSTHIPFIPCRLALPFLGCSYFKIWHWKCKVMGEVKVESHMGPTFSRLASLSFHVNRASIPELWVFQNLTLKIKGQGHGWGHSSKSQCGSSILLTHIPFVPCQSAIPFLRCSIFKMWPWKCRVKVKWSWCCTTTGLDNSIELWMV